jgi:hypothetical protein
MSVDGKLGRTFTIPAAGRPLDASIRVSARGAVLLGDGLLGSDGFAVDGRVDGRGRRLQGWARIGWRPDRPVTLRAEDESGRRIDIAKARNPQAGWQWPFRLDLAATRLRGCRICISAQLPDGHWQPLPDAPLLLPPAIRLPGRQPARLDRWKSHPARPGPQPESSWRDSPIDVVIPVYRGRSSWWTMHRTIARSANHSTLSKPMAVSGCSETR